MARNPEPNRHIRIRQHQLKRKVAEVEKQYYLIVDELEQTLGEQNLKIDLPFSDLKLVKDWSIGDINATEALDQFYMMGDMHEVAYNKIMKKLDKFYNSMDNVEASIENSTRAAIVQLSKEVVPLYIKYLEELKLFFEKVEVIDKARVNVVMGIENEQNFIWQEVPFDQAVRYILGRDLQSKNPVVVNDYVVMFGNTPKNKTAELTHFILCPTLKYVETLKSIFSINCSWYTQGNSSGEWLEELEKKMIG